MTITDLHGAVAFRAVATQLRTGKVPDAPIVHPCLERLSQTLRDYGTGVAGRLSELDLAVLIRQALRFHERQSPSGAVPRLWTPSGHGWPDADLWAKVGVDIRNENNGFVVRAQPWAPEWLPNATPDGVDAASAGENPMRGSTSVLGDPFLGAFTGHESYLTPGQRSAVRAAFTTPPGATLLVCLPTGDGKSFIFQLVASIGYGANEGLPGVTLVVTPTVALALDHQRAANQLGIVNHQSAYFGGMPAEGRRAMVGRIRDGTQGLCFASPEAACGPLRPALIAAAANGLLRTIVVDEAHLVDAWGANFRASFQVLSGLRAEFLDEAPADARPRTLLLSATLTDATTETLRTLFPGDLPNNAGFQLVSSAQLRPEIEYWVAQPSSAAERASRVTEALFHMPRPAILYVTEVAHAERWYRELQGLGYGRIGLMTGKSPPETRERVVQDWRDRRLDLVVGTSAFGLGIDNPNVRTIIHACVPETLDRFYQEVGRGGRDGRSAASIIIPVREDQHWVRDDYKTAKNLNRRRLLTVKTGHRRWSAMFKRQDSKFEGDDVFRLRVDGPPGYQGEYIDMVGETNTEWNVRTMTLMANARMIDLLGPDPAVASLDETDDGTLEAESAKRMEQFQRIRIIEHRHLDIAAWQQVLEPHRDLMEAAYRENLTRMFRFLDSRECVADTLAPVYRFSSRLDEISEPTITSVACACGGCPYCRARTQRRETEPAKLAKHPWPPIDCSHSPAWQMLDNSYRVVIFYPDIMDLRTLRRWTEALAKLVSSGVRNLIALPRAPIDPVAVQGALPEIALFTADKLPPRDYLPPGPTTVIIPPNQPLSDRLLRRRKPADAHFIFVHRDAEFPNMPGVLLRSRFEGPQLANLNLFMEFV